MFSIKVVYIHALSHNSFCKEVERVRNFNKPMGNKISFEAHLHY